MNLERIPSPARAAAAVARAGGARRVRVAIRSADGRRARPYCVALTAWAALLATHASPFAPLFDHAVLVDPSVPTWLALPGLAVGWTLMVAATMLPVAMVASGRRASTAAWVSAYLGVWLCAGLVFAGLDLAIHGALEPRWPALALLLPRAMVLLCCAWLAASVLLAALLPVRRPRHEPRPLRAGWIHGLACLALCWPVMLAAQALAPGHLAAMALAGATSAIVRLAHRLVAGRLAMG